MRLLLPLFALFLATGCDNWWPTVGDRGLDYLIDRPRVVAVQSFPTNAPPGVTRTINALILSPDPVEKVEIALCGLREDIPVSVWESSCFGNEELVVKLGDSLPLLWTPQPLSEPCDTERYDSGYWWSDCWSTVPLLVTAQTQNGRGDGMRHVNVDYESTEFIPEFDPANFTPSLTVTGEVRPGATVDLEFSIETVGFDYFHWWVDAGVLKNTGRTAPHGLKNSRTMTANRLEIPEDFHGPLRVAVVANAEWNNLLQPTWTVLTLEVP